MSKMRNLCKSNAKQTIVALQRNYFIMMMITIYHENHSFQVIRNNLRAIQELFEISYCVHIILLDVIEIKLLISR